MTNDSPVRDFMLPRLDALINDAVAHGFTRDVAVAVAIDLITSSRFVDTPLDPSADAAPQPDWQPERGAPVLVHGQSPSPMAPIGAKDQADFIKPLNWYTD